MIRPTAPLTLEETTAFSIEELFAHDPTWRQWRVVLACELELAELIKTEFRPHAWPEYAAASRSELLWAFLPVLHGRMTSPELWRSRRLLPEAQQHAAETLSHRLRSSGQSSLPSTFTVKPDPTKESSVISQPRQNRLPKLPDGLIVAVLLVLLLLAAILKLSVLLSFLLVALVFGLQRVWTSRSAVVRQFPPELPPVTDPGTQPLLLAAPAVRELTFELERNLSRAKRSSDPGWHYNARAALTEYLPETLRLHGERQGQADDPAFQVALAHIREIATRGSEATELRWNAHERFLEDKARSLNIEDG